MSGPTITGRCATCVHWEGDHKKAAKMFAENPVSMCFNNGWPDSAGCSVQYSWLEIEINGNATADVEVSGAFGCVLHEEIAQ